MDTQATFAKLFADIGVDGDIRYARVDELLKYGPPAPASITARHVQALRTDLRAETLSHAADLTSHTTVLVFSKSEFIGQDEAGHGRSTVGLTRARGTTILLFFGLVRLSQLIAVGHRYIRRDEKPKEDKEDAVQQIGAR